MSLPPRALPKQFNTTFDMTLAGKSSSGRAFWSYDAVLGGQYVWHPTCPFGGSDGCAIVFVGGYKSPKIYAVSSKTQGGAPTACCLFFSGVPILPPSTFSSYSFVINTTILHASRGSLQVAMSRFENRQVFTSNTDELVRILDVSTAWDLPPVDTWAKGPQNPSLFTVDAGACAKAQACVM